MKRCTLIISGQQGRLRKEDAMEPSHSQTTNSTTQPARTPAVWVAHLEEENADKEEGTESKGPNGIEGITEEFIMCLAMAVKDAQWEEICCQ